MHTSKYVYTSHICRQTCFTTHFSLFTPSTARVKYTDNQYLVTEFASKGDLLSVLTRDEGKTIKAETLVEM